MDKNPGKNFAPGAPPIPGDIVVSVMGRDKGRYFIVIDASSQYVYLADGDIRKLDRPKKKKIKHTRHTGMKDEWIAAQIASGQKLTNSQLRKTIAGLPCDDADDV